jgi:Ca2+-binding RTX toxin-like protein
MDETSWTARMAMTRYTDLGRSDEIYGGPGSDVIHGGEGDDTLEGGHYGVSPDESKDVLYGGPGKDDLYGDNGDDVLYGGDGDDKTLWGGPGEDVFYGRDGNDFIDGGSDRGQRDELYCGEGRDYCLADKNDYVDRSCERVPKGGGPSL